MKEELFEAMLANPLKYYHRTGLASEMTQDQIRLYLAEVYKAKQQAKQKSDHDVETNHMDGCIRCKVKALKLSYEQELLSIMFSDIQDPRPHHVLQVFRFLILAVGYLLAVLYLCV